MVKGNERNKADGINEMNWNELLLTRHEIFQRVTVNKLGWHILTN